MILFVNDNAGILFLQRATGIVKAYLAGAIVGTSTVTAGMLLYVGMTGSVIGTALVVGLMLGTGAFAGVITAYSHVTGRLGYLGEYIWYVTEVIKKNSFITMIVDKISNINGD